MLQILPNGNFLRTVVQYGLFSTVCCVSKHNILEGFPTLEMSYWVKEAEQQETALNHRPQCQKGSSKLLIVSTIHSMCGRYRFVSKILQIPEKALIHQEGLGIWALWPRTDGLSSMNVPVFSPFYSFVQTQVKNACDCNKPIFGMSV